MPSHADEYEVYDQLIRDHLSDSPTGGRATEVVFTNSAFAVSLSNGLPGKVDGPALEAFDDLAHRPTEILDARALTSSGLEIVLLSRSEQEKIFSPSKLRQVVFHDNGWWPAFYRRFPNAHGIADVSPVGFDRTRRWAVVYLGNQWEGLAGEGNYFLYERIGTVWVERKHWMTWIS